MIPAKSASAQCVFQSEPILGSELACGTGALLHGHQRGIERIDISMEELNQLLERAPEQLPEEDYQKLKAAVETLAYLTEMVADKDTTIRHLRQLLLPAATEKTKDVLAKAGAEAAESVEQSAPEEALAKDRLRSGHDRNGVEEYGGVKQVAVSYPQLKHGDRCPECGQGKVCSQKDPKVLVRVVGQAPLAATVYSLERLRCNGCCQVFTAQEPEGVGPEKYEETVGAMIVQLKYSSGTPFYFRTDRRRWSVMFRTSVLTRQRAVTITSAVSRLHDRLGRHVFAYPRTHGRVLSSNTLKVSGN
jgi:hypothetical protein